MAKRLTLTVRTERWPYRAPFRISGHVFTESEVIVVELSDGGHVGRGEASGVYFRGETVASMLADVERVRDAVESGTACAELQTLLSAGGARNAIDCALWELESKRSGTPVWRLAGVPEPRALRTTITLGADSPEEMAARAAGLTYAKALKVKFSGDAAVDARRIEAVRAARPDAWIGVDANQGYTAADLPALVALLLAHDVSLLEQPLAIGREADLDGVERPLPFAADECVRTRADLDAVDGRVDVVNIKLDKSGGLTEALALAAEAKARGLAVMVGNMVGTSLAMAPAFVLGQLCDVVDLDGPTFLQRDRAPGVTYADGDVWCPGHVWGVDNSLFDAERSQSG